MSDRGVNEYLLKVQSGLKESRKNLLHDMLCMMIR